jgi:hypothetical protein
MYKSQSQSQSQRRSPSQSQSQQTSSRSRGKGTENEQLEQLVKTYFDAKPFHRTNAKADLRIKHEVEVKFGTRGPVSVTKTDFDNVAQKLKSMGFTSANESGEHSLRIFHEFVDAKTGELKLSNNLRTEINDLYAVQEYCRTNELSALLDHPTLASAVQFVDKSSAPAGAGAGGDTGHGARYLSDVVFSEFHCSVSYKIERTMTRADKRVSDMVPRWNQAKKSFRYLNRVTWRHPELPVSIDMSVVKSSARESGGRGLVLTYDWASSGTLTNPPSYEIEIEVENEHVGPGTDYDTPDKVVALLKRSILYVLSGIQQTNYPVTASEQASVLRQYMQLLHGKERERERAERRAFPSDFVGPQSYTLQMQNIVPLHENVNTPNIRENYVVTDKADGERHLLYVSSKQTQSALR